MKFLGVLFQDGCFKGFLILFSLRVISIYFLLTMSPLNQTSRSQTEEAIDCKTNSPCKYVRKCIEISVENLNTDVRV